MEEVNIAPFYPGQQVVAVDAMIGSYFKNGQDYVVTYCEYKPSGNPIDNPANKYWYVGIEGWAEGKAYYRPSIFRAKETMQASLMTFTEIVAKEELQILINN